MIESPFPFVFLSVHPFFL